MRLSFIVLRSSALAIPALLASVASAQSTLSLDEALKLANQNNGTIRSARLDIQAAKSRVGQSLSSYYPTLTPSYQYNSSRQEFSSGTGNQAFTTEGSSTLATASWRVLDTGQRNYNLASAKQSLASQRYSSRQTLRQTLFTVHQQYYDALRAQELQRVADAQVERANTILEQTKARVVVKDAAAKDVLQAQADLLNARVQSLQARNKTASSAASLKATLGLPSNEPLPALVRLDAAPALPAPESLTALIDEGIERRPDLMARRRSIESERYTWLRQRTDSGVTFAVDGNINQQFTPDRLQNRGWTFLASIPLFDGGLLREQARETNYRIQADKADLVQAERNARAEIESSYSEFTQNRERVEAAKLALDAARTNYNAALESQRLGAGDIIEVLTAQVSLVTAESNFIEAIYDYTISDARLRLATGRPIGGEEA